MSAAALDLVRAATAAGVALEARLWCDAPGRLAPELRDALAQERPAVLRLLLDGQVGEGEATLARTAAVLQDAAPTPVPPPVDDARHQARMDGYRRAALRRPPSLPMNATPGVGCYCTCCAGQVWWCEREAPQGWRCVTCYPPDHLPADAVRRVGTGAAGRTS